MDPITAILGAVLSPTVVVVLLVVVIIFLLYMWFTTPALPGSIAPGNAAAIGAGTSGFQSGPIEGFEQATLSDENRTLQNLQPLTIKQAAYMGGLQFDPVEGIKNAFIAGVRSLVLQIDFLDAKNAGDYAAPGVPTLLYRDNNGLLLSKNGADLAKTMESIATYPFKPEVPNSDKPVILYLHLNRAPNAVTHSKDYLEYLSQIAKTLAPLAPNHLGMTPLGSFNRQKNESLLFRTPISQLGGKFIILSNADTSMFQQSQSLGYGTFDPKEDLDFWVNARVYLQNPSDKIGITGAPTSNTTPSATIVNLSDVLARSSTFGKETLGTYVIAMPSLTENPTPEDLKTALDVAGVIVPLDLFSTELSTIKPLTNQWSKKSFRSKPAALCTLMPALKTGA
jgi:hypothetical protein